MWMCSTPWGIVSRANHVHKSSPCMVLGKVEVWGDVQLLKVISDHVTPMSERSSTKSILSDCYSIEAMDSAEWVLQ